MNRLEKEENILPKVKYQDWGILPYAEAWEKQGEIQKSLIANKRANRTRVEEGTEIIHQLHQLIFCTHPHVYTLGKSGSEDHLLISLEDREKHQVEYYKINRGGDITYHGPGQIVGYPIFDLDEFFTDVHKYVRYLEEAIIRLLANHGIKGSRIEGFTGVWIAPETAGAPKRKICAIGVHLSRWVTLHGFALNVNSNLDFFNHIVPCGIDDEDKTVTSMATELGRTLDETLLKLELKDIFAELFEFDFATVEEK